MIFFLKKRKYHKQSNGESKGDIKSPSALPAATNLHWDAGVPSEF